MIFVAATSVASALQLRAHHERLVQLVARDRPHAHAAVRDERDEPERREAAQRLAHRRPRHVELLRQLLLAEDGSRGELAGDDRLLDHERDVVCLGGVERHSRSDHDVAPITCTTFDGSYGGLDVLVKEVWGGGSPPPDWVIALHKNLKLGGCGPAASVRRQREELDQLRREGEPGEQLLRLRSRLDGVDLRRTRASSKRPARTHCQTCEREISAVAASSIRLSIAAAPTPWSHASR